jgi:hypothetical protein
VSENEILYNIILIDGRSRLQCLAQAVHHLSDDGVIILDDSEREKYAPAFHTALLFGFKQITFYGIKPCGLKTVATTIFYKQNNCLGI